MEVPEVTRKEELGRVPGEESKPEVKNIYLHGHCVLCLRKLKDEQKRDKRTFNSERGNLTEVPEAELPQNVVSTVNWVWDALKVVKEEDGDIFGVRSGPGGGTTFNGVPKMCRECGNRVLGVDKLLKEVRREIGELRRLLRRCKEQGSCRQFVTTLQNLGPDRDMTKLPVTDTVKFLEDFRSRIEPELEEDHDQEEIAIPQNSAISFPGTTEECMETDPLALDDYDGDPDFVAFDDDQQHDMEEDDEDEDYIPSKSKRAKFNRRTAPLRGHQQKKSSPKQQKSSTHQIPEAFEVEFYVKEEQEDYSEEPTAPKSPECNKKPERKLRKGMLGESWSFTRKVVNGRTRIIRKCELCNITYTSQHNLKEHLKREHNLYLTGVVHDLDHMHYCDLCKIQLPRKELPEHVKGHVGEEYTVRCPNKECWFACVTQYGLYTHLKRRQICTGKFVGGFEEFKRKHRTCTVCGFAGKNLFALRGHLLQEHETPEKNYFCPISGCGMKFTLRESVVIHLGQHDVQRQVESQPCLQCGDKKEIKLEEMEAHLKEEHGVEQVVKCRNCSFIFPSWEALVEHMYQHRHGELLCDICGDAGGRFIRHAKLVEHYFTQHQIGKQFVCERDNCSKVFWKRVSLQKHVEMDHKSKNDARKVKPPKQTFNCEDCEMTFNSRNGLTNHRIMLHGDPELSCKYCTETFTNFTAARKHEKEVHKGVKPDKFVCREPNCGRVFKVNASLKHHYKFVHLGEKGSHVCEKCGKVFVTSQRLRSHVDAVHLRLRSYICDACGEAFSSSGALGKHKLIHTGERPYSCSLCSQQFRHKGVLRRHLEGHKAKGAAFKPNGPMKRIRARVQLKKKSESQ